jgi:hypothetical protein
MHRNRLLNSINIIWAYEEDPLSPEIVFEINGCYEKYETLQKCGL